MSGAFERGLVLFQQNRFDLADGEFRRVLAEEPGHAMAHALLGLCLAHRREYAEAGREAEAAVRLAPDLPFAHHALAAVLYDRHRLEEADRAIDEAIRLDPHDAAHFALRAAIRHGQRRWREVLEAAEQGLALDPEDVRCNNLRAMALVQLGRRREAGLTIASALARDPENALTHANQGWALLHQGDHRAAMEHFREALRINPEMEWARQGIVAALKARHLVYRLMLRFFLRMSRLSQPAQWAVLLGFVFGRQILGSISKGQPWLAPWIEPLLFLTFAFLVLTWIADPLFNLLLRFDRFGRLALSRTQVVASNWLGLTILAALTALGVGLATRSRLAFALAAELGFLILPVAGTWLCPPPWPRRVMMGITAGLFVIGPALNLVGSLALRTEAQLRAAVHLHEYFIPGIVLSSWICMLLSQSRPVR